MLASLGGWSAASAASDPNAAALYACGCDESDAGATCFDVCNNASHPSFCVGTSPVEGGQCWTCLLEMTCKPQADACAAN